MKTSAILYNLRIAPRKTKLVADLIKGMDATEALQQLDFQVKKTSPYMKKLLMSAISNGENNLGLDKSNLYVYDVRVSAGKTLKRWMPKAFGRAGQILKRTSTLKIVLEERVEGKGRKSKEEMEKEKKKQLEAKKKEEKIREEKKKEEGKEEEQTKPKFQEKLAEKEERSKKKEGKSWGEKIFRRKSM
jgi:large subunit ribosomal protein L22